VTIGDVEMKPGHQNLGIIRTLRATKIKASARMQVPMIEELTVARRMGAPKKLDVTQRSGRALLCRSHRGAGLRSTSEQWRGAARIFKRSDCLLRVPFVPLKLRCT